MRGPEKGYIGWNKFLPRRACVNFNFVDRCVGYADLRLTSSTAGSLFHQSSFCISDANMRLYMYIALKRKHKQCRDAYLRLNK